MIIVKSQDYAVSGVHERRKRLYVRGYGSGAEFVERSDGWFITVEGYPMSVEAGWERPSVEVGDRIRVEIHKVERRT